MTDALSLDDATVASQLADVAAPTPPADPWLQRRGHGFGGSDLPALLLALGRRSPDGAPDYIVNRARVTNRTRGVARIFAEKAGIVEPLAVGAAAHKGTKREVELLRTWQSLLRRGQLYGEHEALLAPGTLVLAEVCPREWFPLLDRHCPRLTDTPDASIRDAFGALLVVQAKCSASAKPEPPWWWRDQVQGEIAVQAAEGGVLVCGELWAAWHGNDGPIRSWPAERDEAAIEEIRAAVCEGWQRVEELRRAGT